MTFAGVRTLTSTGAWGRFRCPECGPQRYRRRYTRKFLVLFFLPILPIEDRGDYVECQGCSNTYPVKVLEQEGEDGVEAEFQQAIRRVMVIMMMADGRVEDDEVRTVCRIYGEVSGKAVDPDEIVWEGKKAMLTGQNLPAYLRSIAGRLNPSGREMVVKAACMVAMSHGEMAEEERAVLDDVAEALELPPERVAELLESARPGGS